MSLDTSFTPKTGYLEITLAGTVPSDIPDVLSRIFAGCVEYDAHRVLVDCRPVRGLIDTLWRYDFGVNMGDLNLAHLLAGGRPVRFAFLGDEPLVDPQRFAETVAVNRGVDVRIFTEPTDAFQFLWPEPKPEPVHAARKAPAAWQRASPAKGQVFDGAD